MSLRRRAPLLLLLAACAEDEPGEGWFDGPEGAAVLDPSEGGPFEEPVGFIANSRSGTIVPLDLKHGVLLADQAASPFLPPRLVATGDERILGDLAVRVTADDAVLVYAADAANDVLIEAPYLTGFDGVPLVPEPTATDPVFTDADGSGDSPTLERIELRNGYTTTEDWLVDHDGERWWVTGSRSGQQAEIPVPGEEYCTDRRELCFTLKGSATAGDTFTLSTDTGLVEHDLGGVILGLARVPGEDLLLVGLWDPIAEEGSIGWFDLEQRAVVHTLSLGAEAQPWRFAFERDGQTAYAGDARLPAIYAFSWSDTGVEPSTIATEAPVSALAWSQSESGPRLFAALSGENRIDGYDLVTGSWLDVNPYDDATAGLPLRTPIAGLASAPDRLDVAQETAWEAKYQTWGVVVTTFDGSVLLLDAETGCLVGDEAGPRARESAPGVVELTFDDFGPTSDPAMLEDDATGSPIVVNPCGGVARAETWTATWDGAAGNYIVEGSRSGVQEARAWEAERYVSDEGAVSFTILPGSLPTTAGDMFTFTVVDGVLRVDAKPNPDGSESAFELPAAPVVFQYDAGPTGGGWDEVDRRTYALVPVTNSDQALRIRLSPWQLEVVWN